MPGTKIRKGKDTWELQVTLGADYTGRRKRYSKTIHCRSEKEAEKALARFYIECEDGNTSVTDKMTVSAFYLMFKEQYCKRKLKPSTIQRYGVIERNQIRPYIGGRKLASLKKYEVQEWVNDLSDSGLSPKSVKNAWSMLNTMYDIAARWEIVTSNPCGAVELPRQEKKEADFYDLEELKALLEQLEKDMEKYPLYCTMLLLTLFTGLRLSELAGLKWSDIDGTTLHVRRQRQHLSDFGTFESTPKTEKGVRDVTLPGFLVDALHDLKLKYRELALMQGIQWDDDIYILSNEDMSPKGVRALANWWRAYEVEGLRKITFHQLRHTHTAILAHIGVSKYDISARLGHANFSTTLKTYMHILENKEDATAEKLQDAFGRIVAESKK